MANIRNSAIGKAARNIRTSLRASADEDSFKKISSFKKHYEETESKAVREFSKKYSTDFPEHQTSHKRKVRPAVESWNLDGLYVQVLTSVLPTIQSENQPDCESDSMISYLKKTFHMCPDSHKRLQNIANEVKQKSTYVLNVEVVKAKDLSGKDANGLSDPFCTIYISPDEKQYTLVENATLNPVWTEHFSFPIKSMQDDILNIEAWDYDPLETVVEKVWRISEVNSARGLRNLFTEIGIAAAARGKQTNQYLASVQIPIKDIPAEGCEKWFVLEGPNRNKSKGEIFMRMIVGAKKNKQVMVKEYRHIMYLIMAHELAERENRQYSWDGEFSPHAQFILNQLKLQGGLLPCDVVLAQWGVYTRVHCEVPLDTKLFPRILNLILEHLEHGDIDSNEKEIFWRSCEALVDNFASFISNNYQYFLSESTAVYQVQNMIRMSFLLESYLLKKTEDATVNITVVGITDKITNAISVGADNMFNILKMGTAESWKNDIEVAIKIGHQLMADLQKRFEFLDSDFKELLAIQYYETTYRVYDKKYRELVEPLVTKHCAKLKSTEHKCDNRSSQDLTIRSTGANLLELYLALKNFANSSATLKYQADLNIQGNFQSWFSRALIYWLDIAYCEAKDQIRRDVQHDELIPVADIKIDNRCFITSSAAEVQPTFDRMLEFWNQLSVPEMSKTFDFASKIIENLSKLVIYYTKKIIKRVDQLEKNRVKTCLLSHELCFAITNIEHVTIVMDFIQERLEADIRTQLESVLVSTDEYQQNLRKAIKDSNDNAIKEADRILGNAVANQMEPIINRLIVEDLESNPENISNDTFDCLKDNLAKLKKTQSSVSFDKLVVMIWKNVSKVLRNIADKNMTKPRALVYFQRIENLLVMLSKLFFPNESTDNETLEKFQNPDIQEVHHMISLHKTSTDDLITQYIHKRLLQQNENDVCQASMGVLVVQAAYYQEEGLLRVEIVSCTDLRAADMNGLSDPYVKLTIAPQKLFPKLDEKTKVKDKTLSPIFNEMFSIPLTPEQMVTNGVLNFSVKDHDRISKDDFLGEAFLSLEMTRVFEHLRTSSTVKVTDFPRIHLALSVPDSRMSRLLQVLESRQEDEQAVKFAKKERAKQVELKFKKKASLTP